MSSVLEKADGTIVVSTRITLKPGRDDKLIRLVRSASPRCLAGVIREAMRNGSDMFLADSGHYEDVCEIDLSGLGIDL